MASNHIFSCLTNGVRLIKFNRPEKKNAVSVEMFRSLAEILNADANNDEVVITILTGTGDYYSSGTDITSSMEHFAKTEITNVTHVNNMIRAFMNYPKLLIAVVNGPAIGIVCSTLALCDIIYATEHATFETAFIRNGLSAEGCSSFMFPRILGRSKASEMILLEKTMSAEEALRLGFVSEIIPQEKLDDFIKSLYKYGKLPSKAVQINKALMKKNFEKTLHECHEREMNQIHELLQSPEFTAAMKKFVSRKNKL